MYKYNYEHAKWQLLFPGQVIICQRRLDAEVKSCDTCMRIAILKNVNCIPNDHVANC